MGEIIAPKHVELIEIFNKIIVVASSWLIMLLYGTIVLEMRLKPCRQTTNECILRSTVYRLFNTSGYSSILPVDGQ